ncbi:MAG: DUF2007 domain-containing protein [Bacteroidales bacterium]|nr:DUF2007 domain-containing protein [Bacteroidales bacterium]
MKTVKYYANDVEAQMDRSLLEAEGITSNVLNENMNYAGYFAGSNFDIQLVVADEDYDLAIKILAAPPEPIEE